MKNKGYVLAFAILAFVIIVESGYLIYTQVVKSGTLNNENKIETSNNKVSIEDETVKKLYSYVTYGREYYPDDIVFFKNAYLTEKSFTNYQKYYMMSQFVNENDLKKSENMTATDTVINEQAYTLTLENIDTYMKQFFGDNVNYNKKGNFFYINKINNENKNISLFYDEQIKKYNVILANVDVTNIPKTNYISKLDEAYKNSDEIIIKEKNLFYYSDTENNLINVYKDYESSLPVGTLSLSGLTNIEEEAYKKYSKDAMTVIYTFKKGKNSKYYFYSSKIEY